MQDMSLKSPLMLHSGNLIWEKYCHKYSLDFEENLCCGTFVPDPCLHTQFPKYNQKKEFWSWFGVNMASGALAGASSLLIVYREDLFLQIGTDFLPALTNPEKFVTLFHVP